MRRRRYLVLILVAVVILRTGQESAAQGVNPDNLRARVLAAVNTARIANNLPPYALNAILTEAAQAHSEYQCATGEIAHEGADGGLAFDRVIASGYPGVWVNENIYGGRAEPEEAVRWWLTADPAHRNNVLHESLREVGIGIGVGEDGMICYTMDISAQPGVLPVFINGGAETTGDPRVGLTLTTEAVFTDGDSIGVPVQVLISNSPDFADPVLLPWAAKIAWTLDAEDSPGSKTVYVRYIDAVGRSADASDNIVYLAGSSLTSTVSPTATVAVETITPTASEAAQPTTMTEAATAMPTANPPTTMPRPVQATAQASMTPVENTITAPTMIPGLTVTQPQASVFPTTIRIPTLPVETPRQQYFVAAAGAGALALIILYLIIRSRG